MLGIRTEVPESHTNPSFIQTTPKCGLAEEVGSRPSNFKIRWLVILYEIL